MLLTIGIATVLTVVAFVLLVLTGTSTKSTAGDLLILALVIAGATALGYGVARAVFPR